MPSHWELPVLPPPDAEGHLSSTDLLNWWFRSPQNRGRAWDDFFRPRHGQPAVENTPRNGEPAEERSVADDPWFELDMSLPAPEEHLADEHAQGAVDCLYDFLHSVGERDLGAAAELIDDGYHTIEEGEEVDKAAFVNGLAAQLDELRHSDFDVSLAVAPEPIHHPYGVLIHAIIQFDAETHKRHTRSGRVERRVTVLRQNDAGAWRIVSMAKVDR